MKSTRSVTSSVANGVAWMLAMRMSYRVLGLVSTVILARLLSPEDFGVVAIAMSIFALLHLIKDFGFDTVIIQMEAPEKRHYDTAWTFNLIFGVALAIIFVLSASLIAELYEIPDLKYLIWAIASLFIIGGFESVGTLDFRKNLTFDKEFRLKIIPKLIGLPTTLVLAYYLRDYWSLTIGTIVTQISILAMGYWMHTYRPKFNLSATKELFNFSKWLLLNNLIYYINIRSPELVVGKLLGTKAAGIYTISYELSMIITAEFSAAVSRATYPGYSKIAKKPDELKSLYLNVIKSSALILFPLALGFYSVAEIIVPVILGDQWMDSIPLMKIISIGGLLMALNSNTGYVFMAMGNPRLSTILGTLRVLVFIPLLIILSNTYGLVGSGWAILITTIIMFVISSLVTIQKLLVSVKDLFLCYFRPMLSAFLMVLTIKLIGFEPKSVFIDNFITLLVMIALGGFVYICSVLALWYMFRKPYGPESKAITVVVKNIFHISKKFKIK